MTGYNLDFKSHATSNEIHSYSKRTRSTPTLATFASTFLGKEHEDLYPERTYGIVIIEVECTHVHACSEYNCKYVV